jgi:aldehyde:ferredoxin oxidoreductase
MPKGYMGRLLFVDLTTGSFKEETLSDSLCREYIGGIGFGAKILYERMRPGVDPLGPANMLGFLVGPLTGTGIHGARFQVVTRSPLTGGWRDAHQGICLDIGW